jgi:hypothetical protein
VERVLRRSPAGQPMANKEPRAGANLVRDGGAMCRYDVGLLNVNTIFVRDTLFS